MSATEHGNEQFTVVREDGQEVFTGEVPEESARWSATYPFVYQLDFSVLREPGRYRLEAGGTTSVEFQIGGPDLLQPFLMNSVSFMKVQRDGPEVDTSLLDRRPSHLKDRKAKVYKKPKYADFGLQGTLHRVGGPVDVSGGGSTPATT